MKFGFAIVAIALIFAAGLASAAVSAMPREITIGQAAYDFSFYAQNNTAIRQPLVAEFAFPTKFTIIKKPQWIEANSRQNVIVRIFPQKGFEGTTYTGTVKISVGADVAEKNVLINYILEDECQVRAQTEIDGSGKATIALTNNSYNPVQVALEEIRNVPADWKISGNTDFSLGAFETKSFEVQLERNSGFTGDAKFVFSCGEAEFTQTAQVSYQDRGIPATIFAMVSGASAEGEFVLDMFLVIVASILLIAFIARMVKFLNDGKQNTEAQK